METSQTGEDCTHPPLWVHHVDSDLTVDGEQRLLTDDFVPAAHTGLVEMPLGC